MESFGQVIARVIAEWIMITEATLSEFVSINIVSGNITNIAMTPLGEAFADNWSRLIVSLAYALNDMICVLWSV